MDNNSSIVQPEKTYHCLAVASFVLAATGIISLPTLLVPFFGLIPWIASLTLGIIAQRKIHKKKENYKGGWMSVTAIFLSILVILASALWQIISILWISVCSQNPGHPC